MGFGALEVNIVAEIEACEALTTECSIKHRLGLTLKYVFYGQKREGKLCSLVILQSEAPSFSSLGLHHPTIIPADITAGVAMDPFHSLKTNEFIIPARLGR